jgi:hypothetical protein
MPRHQYFSGMLEVKFPNIFSKKLKVFRQTAASQSGATSVVEANGETLASRP